MESRYLLINLSHLHLRSMREISDNYISIHWDGRFYFSNAYNTSDAVQYSITLNHNLVLQFDSEAQYSLTLQSWENHMIMFQHEVDISELKTRSATRKRVEIRQGEILDFTVHILKNNEFHLSKDYSKDVIQHFVLIHNMTLNDYDTTPDHGPSFIAVQHDAGTMFVPVVNAVAIVSLPSKLRFKHYKNGKVRSTSRVYECQEIIQTGKVRMVAGQDAGYDMEIGLLWGINLWHNLPQRSILLDAQEILIYEIEVRLQAWKEMPSGAKIRINYANKSFELNGESQVTVLRFGRIIYFVMKSQQEDFSVIIEKNLKILAKAVIGSEELMSYHLNTLKKKLLDPNGKHMASIRFKCEKAKSLSLPHSNPLWKNSNLKTKQPSVVLQFSQLSIQWQKNEPCGLVIKTEEQEVFVPELTNFDFFQLQIEIPQPVIITLHQECNIYLKVVNSQNKEEFLGIAVLNFGDLRLGINVLTLPFFKQQVASCLLHLIVNKVVSWPFIRGINVPQGISGLALHMIGISVQIKRIQLTGYYYSYQYDRKKEIYCIVEINRIKKVLILEQFNTLTKALLFVNSEGSDILNFTVDHNESARIRLTLLVGDQGYQEEVYGVLQKRLRVEDLKDGPARFQSQEVANDHGISVGVIDFEVQSGLSGEYRKPIKKDLKNVQNSLDKVNKSIAKVERSISKKQIAAPQGRKRYESLKLPQIKDPRQERLKKLAKMLQMKQKQSQRKRAERGRRVESQRQAEIIRDSRAIDSRAIKNYTSIQRPPQEIRQSQIIQSKHQIQEQKLEVHEDLNLSKGNEFLQQLNDNEFLNTHQV